MTTINETYPERNKHRMKKLLAVTATALIAGAALAVPALALQTGPNTTPPGPGVRPDHNISVFHNLDFVAAFGYPVGQNLKVEVFSKTGNLKGSATAPAIEVDEGLTGKGALEVNHGPETVPPADGDCWEGTVPNVVPGDLVRVTELAEDGSAIAVDEVLVDNIRINQGPTDNKATRNTTDVIVKGVATYADGTPIPISKLDSGEVRQAKPRFRANPDKIIRTPGTVHGWTAIYRAPYEVFQMPDPLTVQQQKRAILNGDHAMGYGHVAPLPRETQLVEGLGGGGPAPGCNGTPADG